MQATEKMKPFLSVPVHFLIALMTKKTEIFNANVFFYVIDVMRTKNLLFTPKLSFRHATELASVVELFTNYAFKSSVEKERVWFS